MTDSRGRLIRDALALSNQLIDLTLEGEAEVEDDACLVLFGIIFDSASKIRGESEKFLRKLDNQAQRGHG